jgi:alanine racemase
MNPAESFACITTRPTVMRVDLAALAANFRALRDYARPAKVMAVVKANAYGHGMTECASHLVRAGAECLGVAFVEEGIELRRAGIGVPILVFGGILGTQIQHYLDYDLDLTASSVGKLEAIEDTAARLKKRARVHLKIDTGMERLGVHYYTASTLVERALACRHCDIVGIFSHFACADEEDARFTRVQIERFIEVCALFEKRRAPVPLRHIANSAGVLGHKESHLDLVRPGLALYGVYPAPHLAPRVALTPVMSLRSKVVFFKVVKAGAGVSYGHTFRATRDTRVVTIPIGYGDGFFRLLSNRGSVLIRGRRFPIVGNVCMDQLMVDLGPGGEAYNGDEVVLVGSQGKETVTVNDIAALVGTISYEVLTSINLRVPREYTGA